MSIGLGIDPFNSLMAQQQQAYINSIVQQQAAAAIGWSQCVSPYQSALGQNVAQSANPDERLLVLLTEE